MDIGEFLGFWGIGLRGHYLDSTALPPFEIGEPEFPEWYELEPAANDNFPLLKPPH